MKSPDDIKKGMECCTADGGCKWDNGCPYGGHKECAVDLKADALALIQQLEAQVPRWISVEERLPEDVVDVLLFVCFGPERRIQFGWHIEDEWHDHDGNIYGDVTHWMPLPEPQKD